MSMILNPYRYAAGGGDFSPTDISGLTIWLDASAEVLEAVGPDDNAENGDSVVMWRDQSGNGNDPSSLAGCTFATSPNRIAVGGVANDGVIYNTNPLSGESATSVIAVCETTSIKWVFVPDSIGTQFAGAAENASAASPDASAGSPSYYADGSLLPSPDRNDLHDNFSTGSKVVVSALGVNMSIAGWEACKFFSYHAASYYFSGDIFEIIAYDSEISSGDHTSLVNYLKSKHSIV